MNAEDANFYNRFPVLFPVNMTNNQEQQDADLAAGGTKLPRGSWPVWVAFRGRGRRAFNAWQAAAGAGYKYRRPVPPPDDEDDVMPQRDGGNSALHELEEGLAAAANGPPHEGDDDAGGEDGGLATAHSSPLSANTPMNTEEALAFAMEWEGEAGAGAGGPVNSAKKLSTSPDDPADFQAARESARSQLAMGAYFSSMGKEMLEEVKRARAEADNYLAEVTGYAKASKLRVYSFSNLVGCRVSSGSTELAAPSARPRITVPSCGPCTSSAARSSALQRGLSARRKPNWPLSARRTRPSSPGPTLRRRRRRSR